MRPELPDAQRRDEIVAAIAARLGQGRNSEARQQIRGALEHMRKDYHEHCIAEKNSPRIKDAGDKTKTAIRNLGPTGSIADYGSATFNLFDEDPARKQKDEEFRVQLEGVTNSLNERKSAAARWHKNPGRVTVHQMAHGTPKQRLAGHCVKLIARYKPDQISSTEYGLVQTVADLAYEFATGMTTELKGSSMLRAVRTCVSQYQYTVLKNKQSPR